MIELYSGLDLKERNIRLIALELERNPLQQVYDRVYCRTEYVKPMVAIVKNATTRELVNKVIKVDVSNAEKRVHPDHD